MPLTKKKKTFVKICKLKNEKEKKSQQKLFSTLKIGLISLMILEL